jgi:hypothetical protein
MATTHCGIFYLGCFAVAVAVLVVSVITIGFPDLVCNKSLPPPLNPPDLISTPSPLPITPHPRDPVFSDKPPPPIHSTSPPLQKPSVLQNWASTRHFVIYGWLDDFTIIWDLTSSVFFYLWRWDSTYSSVARKVLPHLGHPAFNQRRP